MSNNNWTTEIKKKVLSKKLVFFNAILIFYEVKELEKGGFMQIEKNQGENIFWSNYF